MMRTKYMYIAVIMILVSVLVLTVVLEKKGVLQNIYNKNIFGVTQDSYIVIHNTPAQSDRESFIERVRQSIGDQPRENVIRDAIDDTKEIKPTAENPEVLVVKGAVSTNEHLGSVYVCATPSHDVSPVKDASWIVNGVSNNTHKPVIQGSVVSQHSFIVTDQDNKRVYTTNGIPAHPHGIFSETSVSVYELISGTYTAVLPIIPVLASHASCVPAGGPVGILNTGSFLYSAVLEEQYDARAHSVFDVCGGHVDTVGTYHYHDESNCVPTNADGATGYALDGFGIFPSVENGVKITNEALDACHGHAHRIMWNGVQTLMYHYHMTDEYPYSVGCFKGTPVSVISE